MIIRWASSGAARRRDGAAVAAAMLLLSALAAVSIPTADAWALLPSTILIQGRKLISSLILVWMHHRMLVG